MRYPKFGFLFPMVNGKGVLLLLAVVSFSAVAAASFNRLVATAYRTTRIGLFFSSYLMN